MQYDEFVGEVQNKARLADTGRTVRAIHATLQTLGERLHGGEPGDLAAQLPQEIGKYLTESEEKGTFDMQTFFERVAEREQVDLPDAVYHAQAVMAVVEEAVQGGELADVRAQLPAGYAQLFEYDQGQQ